MDVYDIAIIGGGINGSAIAADAALRGLKVALIEKKDLACETSSKSTKLIHGGLRYLEYLHINFVRKALNERSLLYKLAPHIIKPIKFILPITNSTRSKYLIRLALFLYDNLSLNNKLPYSKYINSQKHPEYFKKLSKNINNGFVFYDCATNDRRLTIENALQAKEHGADILTYHELLSAQIKNDLWECNINDNISKKNICIKAKVIINATGPWVIETAKKLNTPLDINISLVKGSHIFLPKLYTEDESYVLQAPDLRIVFVIPYENYTMVGTTEIDINNLEDRNIVTHDEINYLLSTINNFFKKQSNPEDIIYKYAASRVLIGKKNTKSTKLNREHSIISAKTPAPIAHIIGGKITTYRSLAKETIDCISYAFNNLRPSISHNISLPGSQTCYKSYNIYLKHAYIKYHWLHEDLLDMYLKRYGTRTDKLLKNCSNLQDLGKEIIPNLYELEIKFLCKTEWVYNSKDLLAHISQEELKYNDEYTRKLDYYLNNIYNKV